MFKASLGVFFVSLLLTDGQVWSCGHNETIYAERIIGKLGKGIDVPISEIGELLDEAAKSERGSSQGSGDSLNNCVKADTDWLIKKAESIFNEQEMDNLGRFLENLYKEGEDKPAALAGSLSVIRHLF